MAFSSFFDNSLNLVCDSSMWMSVEPCTRVWKIISCHIFNKELLLYPQQLFTASSSSGWGRSWRWSIPSMPGFCLSWSYIGNRSCYDGHSIPRRQHNTLPHHPALTFFLISFSGILPEPWNQWWVGLVMILCSWMSMKSLIHCTVISYISLH